MNRSCTIWQLVLAVCISPAASLVATNSAHAALTVYGGPTYTPGVGGYLSPGIDGFGSNYGSPVNDSGTAVGYAEQIDSSDMGHGIRPVRWDGTGNPAIELDSLAPGLNGYFDTYAFAINNAGTAVGYSRKFDSFESDIGQRPVRWSSAGTVVTELDTLGIGPSDVTFGEAWDINANGTSVGYAAKFAPLNVGQRAVRWDASGTAATELDSLGTALDGTTFSQARAINDSGTAVGDANFYDGAGNFYGYRAVRWDASGTAATQLDDLGTDTTGYAFNRAVDVSALGTAVGLAEKYDGLGNNLGFRAVRWSASGTAATELGHLGTDLSGVTDAGAFAVNAAGDIAGIAYKYDGLGNNLGIRAIRWDASGTAATEMGNLGTDVAGISNSQTAAINNSGIAVGFAEKYNGVGTLLGQRAVYWNPNGTIVDLNTLISPASGWTLNSAYGISDTNWIAGIGSYDPDGFGGQEGYNRLYLVQITAVPEPSGLALLIVGLTLLSPAARFRRNAQPSYVETDSRR